MSKKGVDISYCQKGLDIKNLKDAGIEFVIMRAGYHFSEDTELKNHIKGVNENDIPYGFYWFSRAFSAMEAKSEAVKCLEVIKQYSPSYPVFYDMEDSDQIEGLTRKERTDIIVTFCEEIKKAGYMAGVYLNPSWMENYVDKTRLIGKYEVWLAHWTENPNIPSKYDYGQVMWQWGLDKINGWGVDGDICFKDYPIKTKKPTSSSNDEETDNSTTNALSKGDEVKLKNAALYAASTSTTKANTISGTYYIYTDGVINNRIRITTNKGNGACTGWVNVSDCNNSTSTTPPQPTTPTVSTGNAVTLKKGDEVKLTNASLYGAAVSTVKANTLTGTYYVHSDGITNNRIRITTSKGNAACTGWINISDCNAVSTSTQKPAGSTPVSGSVSLKKGDTVKLTSAALYGAATSTAKANTITGTYYIHSDGVTDNRIRITTSKNNTVCTGWVNVSDCKA